MIEFHITLIYNSIGEQRLLYLHKFFKSHLSQNMFTYIKSFKLNRLRRKTFATWKANTNLPHLKDLSYF